MYLCVCSLINVISIRGIIAHSRDDVNKNKISHRWRTESSDHKGYEVR